MKSLRLDRWASHLHPPRNPRLCLAVYTCPFLTTDKASNPRRRRPVDPSRYQIHLQWPCQRRSFSRSSSVAASAAIQEVDDSTAVEADVIKEIGHEPNFPRLSQAARSAKLAALHARLSLPAKLPLETLARCLIDPSVETTPGYNNASLAILGQDLLGYYTSEYLICHYPRLPMAVLYAAQYAYVGPATLAAMRAEWGVEFVAAPGPEVDPGLLQLRRVAPGNAMSEDGTTRVKDIPRARKLGSGRRNEEWHYRRGMSSRIVYDDQFGDLHTGSPQPEEAAPFLGAPISEGVEGGDAISTPAEEGQRLATSYEPSTDILPLGDAEPATVEEASAGFVRALAGALYLHAGVQATKDFHRAHFLSRHLELHQLFNFKFPTRDLATLCKREGLEPPVARIISETGRLSRTPVFVIGVFSGNDKLGEAAGASLNEGRVRAAAAALRSWYLYSPLDTEIFLPSDVQGPGNVSKKWKPQHIDPGEVVT